MVFIVRAGVREVLAQWLRAGPRALWLLVPYAVGTAIGGLPLGLFLPSSARPSPAALIQSRFAASSANSLLPFFGLAGEPSRLLWLRAEDRAQGLAAIVIDRVLYNCANGTLLVAGGLIAWVATPLPRYLVLGALAIGALTLALSVGGFALVARVGLGRRMQALVRRFSGTSGGDHEFGQRVDERLLEAVRGPIRPLLAAASIHLVGRAAIAIEAYVGLWALGAGASAGQATVLAVVPILLSFFFSSVPSQIGVQEGAQMLVASALNLSPTLVLSLVLLQRFRQLVFAALLPFLLAAARPPAPHGNT